LLLGEAPVRAVAARRAHLLGQLLRLHLGFLHAYYVGLLRFEKVEEALLPRRAQPVDVPGHQDHRGPVYDLATRNSTQAPGRGTSFPTSAIAARMRSRSTGFMRDTFPSAASTSSSGTAFPDSRMTRQSGARRFAARAISQPLAPGR